VGLFVDLSKEACPVHLWDEGDLTDVAKSLDEFLGQITGPAIEVEDAWEDDEEDEDEDEDE
jgi:hypothetical protein